MDLVNCKQSASSGTPLQDGSTMVDEVVVSVTVVPVVVVIVVGTHELHNTGHVMSNP